MQRNAATDALSQAILAMGRNVVDLVDERDQLIREGRWDNTTDWDRCALIADAVGRLGYQMGILRNIRAGFELGDYSTDGLGIKP